MFPPAKPAPPLLLNGGAAVLELEKGAGVELGNEPVPPGNTELDEFGANGWALFPLANPELLPLANPEPFPLVKPELPLAKLDPLPLANGTLLELLEKLEPDPLPKLGSKFGFPNRGSCDGGFTNVGFGGYADEGNVACCCC